MTDLSAMAEAIERARFDQLHQGRWDELREGERATRVQILREALLVSGAAAEVEDLRAQAERVAELSELVSRQERDAATTLALHDEELVRLSDTIAALSEQSAQLAGALAESQARAEAAEAVVAAVRETVAAAAPHGHSRH